MSFLKKLFGKKDEEKLFTDEEIIAAGACPNCWGIQEYDGKIETYYKDQTKANISHDKQHQKAFVQQFIETNITGIRLKREGDLQVCPTCKTKYKVVSSKAI